MQISNKINAKLMQTSNVPVSHRQCLRINAIVWDSGSIFIHASPQAEKKC